MNGGAVQHAHTGAFGRPGHGDALPLRIVIVDDEPLARARLKSLVQACDWPRSSVVAECANAAELMALNLDHADCVLMDIQMPGTNGLELAARLRQQAAVRPAVVFVTAHDEHALRAFELEAADYLTKPVRAQRLQAALERVARQRKPPAGGVEGEVGMLQASERGRMVGIPVHAIVSMRAELKYVAVRSIERTWVLDESLTELEHRLGEWRAFMRVHRSALVAIASVTALEKRAFAAGSIDDNGELGWAVHLAVLDEWLPVSRRQLPAVRECLDQRRDSPATLPKVDAQSTLTATVS